MSYQAFSKPLNLTFNRKSSRKWAKIILKIQINNKIRIYERFI
nr:MAG TPA: hypothetical protein [Caudoviricetes sp.]